MRHFARPTSSTIPRWPTPRSPRCALPSKPGPSRDGLDAFETAGGDALRLHALFEAISLDPHTRAYGAGWHSWPDALQDPASEAVRALSKSLADEVAFHIWLQMIARRQLAEASAAARASGMRIGLYLDLAVGEAPDGSSTWSGAAAALPHLSIGAPPDMFSAEGQDWGLAAPSPAMLQQMDYAPFREMVLAQVRDAGALRIDHAMALWQLFLIPIGTSPSEGTHLRYPFRDMLEVLADLSQTYHAVMIGEDLGFVPRGFRHVTAEADLLSYRILVFEQDEHGFKPLSAYPEKALACLSTHDLPVLAGWWRGEDIDRRREFGLVNAEQSADEAVRRRAEKAALVERLQGTGVLDGEVDAGATDLPDGILDAAHRFLARTPSLLVGIRMADLVGPSVPTNVPGTTHAYPNWRPRSPVAVSDIADRPEFRDTTALMREERARTHSA